MGVTLLSNPSILRLNVGFIVSQSIGYSRIFSLEIPGLRFSDELEIRNLEGQTVISRTTEGLLVQVKGQATTALECVYCLNPYEQALNLDFVEMFTFPSNALEDTDQILPEDPHIALSPLIREYLYLEIPINPMCRAACKGLCSICGENRNLVNCNHEDESFDPRLSVLKSLLDDDEEST